MMLQTLTLLVLFFLNDSATSEIYTYCHTLSLHDALPISEVAELAVSFLIIAALVQVADGAQVVAQGMLRGLHDTFVPMLFALFGYWVIGIGVGAWLAFERDWGGVGIWTGLATGLSIVAVLMLTRWMQRERLGLVRVAAPLREEIGRAHV